MDRTIDIKSGTINKLIKDKEGNLVINNALKELIGYKELSEQHSENREAVRKLSRSRIDAMRNLEKLSRSCPEAVRKLSTSCLGF